ncbi:preprotein translocase subunit TatA [Candidatus Thioglobus autotrophicus]|jgi:sec-independent protein translocase protein TatB|uniref:Preprotein translocase subunit TatA n=1 Tax=Candidatus Thioglobus autotrophicus TaxID=1705394 RepID=A0A0M4NU53_9GAMM|nr:Sec-independent protein translocase protein TatB [Candidatus Thioglobus autotrophicus]ALE52769.1 preprotein translocase subunit TatA [Candidatus Thioglobus autotrophicus]WPE16811.1 Sec-independent protein translocase protein TatB [Candidatus Thioglobus autotrophicus]
MFDVGFWEFALIGVIALIIVGPERMPGIARTAGKYAGKAKRFIAKIQDDVGEELEVDKLKEQLNAMDKDANIVEIFDETKQAISDIKTDVDKTKS